MIELTFKGANLAELCVQLAAFLDDSAEPVQVEVTAATAATAPQVPAVTAAAASPIKARGPKPKPKAKVKLKDKMAKLSAAYGGKAVEKPVETPASADDLAFEANVDDIVFDVPEPEPEPISDPAKLAAIRVKTTEDLQAAYSSGKHKQVLELLAKYGNGAKSFRELAIKDFLPIRQAIDEGALA